MPSATVEDYVKALWSLSQHAPNKPVGNGELAAHLNLTPGSTSAMCKTLADAELVTVLPRKGVQLTETGHKLALSVLRRHRLIELFLVETLELGWDEVHDEAEVLEHAISERVLEAIDRHLGHPEVDPHGAPIPSADGQLQRPALTPLSDLPEGLPARITRVSENNPAFLRHLEQIGLTPGTTLSVITKAPLAGTLTLEANNQRHTLSLQAARQLQCQA